MLKQEFLKEMEDILDVSSDALTGDENLAEFGAWDSLAMLAFSVLAGEKLGREITGAAIRKAQTLNDLYSLATQNSPVHV
ncbi:MAG: acyl carrier protein [Terracidiphilus sp.]